MKKLLVLLLASTAIVSCEKMADFNTQQERPSENQQAKTEMVNLGNGIIVEKVDNEYILQEDMILSEKQIKELRTSPITRGIRIPKMSVKKWPNKIVYYTYQSGFIPRESVNTAIEYIQRMTNLEFKMKASTTEGYIYFQNATSNISSSIGYTGSKQNINLTSNTGSGVALHEICHTLGLMHEHCRSDRDNYITIKWDNIKESTKANFAIITSNYENEGNFDFNSVMMYGSMASSNSAINATLPVLTKKDGTTVTPSRSLSSGDLAALKSLYP